MGCQFQHSSPTGGTRGMRTGWSGLQCTEEVSLRTRRPPATDWVCSSLRFSGELHQSTVGQTSEIGSSAPGQISYTSDMWISALLCSTRTAAYWIPQWSYCPRHLSSKRTDRHPEKRTANRFNTTLAGAPKHSSNCPPGSSLCGFAHYSLMYRVTLLSLFNTSILPDLHLRPEEDTWPLQSPTLN